MRPPTDERVVRSNHRDLCGRQPGKYSAERGRTRIFHSCPKRIIRQRRQAEIILISGVDQMLQSCPADVIVLGFTPRLTCPIQEKTRSSLVIIISLGIEGASSKVAR